MTESQNIFLTLKGHLAGHNGWVTSIVTGHSIKENEDTQVLITGSRDKTILIWKFENEPKDEKHFAQPYQQLTGHSHFISDLSLTSDNNYLLSSSWDKSMRLWDLKNGVTTQRFVGHSKEVLSCAFSSDNRQIISSGSDRVVKLWNVKGACRFTSAPENNHSDWVSSVSFLGRNVSKGNFANSFFASTGWDGRLKIWNSQSFEIKDSFRAHDGNINALTTSPKGTFIVTGGKDSKVRVWDFNNCENAHAEFDAGSSVTALAFNPKSAWIAVGTETGVTLWDYENKNKEENVLSKVDYETEQSVEATKEAETEEKNTKKKTKPKRFHQVTSLEWNAIGTRLFVGFSNGVVRVYEVQVENQN